MKTFLRRASAFCLLSLFTTLFAQDSAPPTAYQRCTASIKDAPQDAYEPCRQYLEQTPPDTPEHLERIKTWVAKYEKVLPYVQFLQSLSTDQNASWIVYEPDTRIDLPQTSEKEGPFQMEISRSFGDAREEAMLRTAEAVYPGPGEMVEDVFRSLNYWANEPLDEMAPIWGMRGNDEIQSTHLVTARAVRYYYDLTRTLRQNSHLPSGFDAVHTDLKYVGTIKHFDHYSHQKDKFENVYVAELTLTWGFTCGGLCGMGFTRNKMVVLDGKGEVVAMYLDAAANSQSWVS
jgi:hypothetical protein